MLTPVDRPKHSKKKISSCKNFAVTVACKTAEQLHGLQLAGSCALWTSLAPKWQAAPSVRDVGAFSSPNTRASVQAVTEHCAVRLRNDKEHGNASSQGISHTFSAT
jgi:hypothetical protein